MGYCDGIISQSIEPNCENPIVPGIEANGVIINRDDIDFSGVVFEEGSEGVVARTNVIKTLPLKTGKKAYKIYVPTNQPFNGTNTTLEEGTNRNTFTNNLNFVILENDPDVCDNIIDGLATGKFVVIYENKYKNLNKATNKGDSAFQIVGYYQGLQATTLENDKWSEDTDGGWNVVLTETRVPKSALFLFNTDYETTKTQVETLTAVQS